MFYQRKARPPISGAFVVVTTRTFLLLLAVAPVGFYAPRWASMLLGVALVVSLIIDWKRTSRTFRNHRL